MGWPKNRGLRLYFERKSKTFLLVDTEAANGAGCYDAVGELTMNVDPKTPRLVTTSVSPDHLYRRCRRASWDEMPRIWRDSFIPFLNRPPEDHRGLWRVTSPQEMACLIGKDEDLDRYIMREMRTCGFKTEGVCDL